MSLEESLSAVEQLIDKVSTALLAADPQSLEQHSTALRDAAAQFARVLEQFTARGLPLPESVQKRVNAVGDMLVVHRESLARLSAVADRQAAGLLPPSDAASTYGDGSAARAAKPGVARIYRSAG
ncbi:hypothetical protein [Acidovorax sp. FJL06]|uniref:hypothetical protein n=1 Tax=Acidovorax sp. FJL06 TaxID=2153365 RepID=UPI000F581E0D|nr:hypothetical protein [Acidovorax sp. FJL06]RQO80489.1 hypothetical protein DBV10_19245 [Acidovorax sp. FJL06]